MFLCFFGSFINSDTGTFRDIDIAVFMNPVPDLNRLGFLISECEYIADLKVDLLVLNELYKDNAYLAQEAITSSEMVPNTTHYTEQKVRSNYAEYCVAALNYYDDTAGLRQISKHAFRKRMQSNSFAKRNYVE